MRVRASQCGRCGYARECVAVRLRVLRKTAMRVRAVDDDLGPDGCGGRG